MAKIDTVKRIIVEDFPDEDKPTIEKLAYILNDFMSQVVDAFNKNITIDNLKQNIIDYEVMVDADGKPISGTTIKISGIGEIKGLIVIYAQNKTNVSLFPTSTPFVSFVTQGDGQYTIKNVSGLQLNNKYLLRLLAIAG